MKQSQETTTTTTKRTERPTKQQDRKWKTKQEYQEASKWFCILAKKIKSVSLKWKGILSIQAIISFSGLLPTFSV